MIDPEAFVTGLDNAGIQFVTGVPDSLLKQVCACITNKFDSNRHIIATNEGSAGALAIGHYLATSRPALVYMQNSGLGNIINPIASLGVPDVYGIPMVLMVGWRGEIVDNGDQLHDEPQHTKQGRITAGQLDLLGIPYTIIDADTPDIGALIQKKVCEAQKRSGPTALLVRKNTFGPCRLVKPDQSHLPLIREEVIEQVLSLVPENSPVVSTTGKPSREVFESRAASGTGHQRDFLTVGGMGHASQIAAGIAMSLPNRKVVCLDGDGATLMHNGAMAISADCDNLLHIVLNNEAHDSVGGQPTKGNVLHFERIAAEFGYHHVAAAQTKAAIQEVIPALLDKTGSALLEIRCRQGARENLGRPTRTPAENKADFMSFLRTM